MAKFNWDRQNKLAKAQKPTEKLPKCTSAIKTVAGPQEDWMRRLGYKKLELLNDYIKNNPDWFINVILKSKKNKRYKILDIRLQPKQIVSIRDYFETVTL